MPTDLEALAAKVRNDSVSGSSETAIYVLAKLHDILSNNEAGSGQLLEFAKLIRSAKPAMAPLANIAMVIELASEETDPNKAALVSVEKIIANEKTAGIRIAEAAMEKVEGTVLTLSYSGTVVYLLKAVAKKKEIKVIVAESFPLGEGRRTAEMLIKAGIETTMITDSMVFPEARNSDLCLVGADAITRQALVNKVGTYAAALGSVQAGIPAYIASSTLKVTDRLKPDWMIQECKKGKLTERTQIFEPVPLELFAEVFTENGAMRPGRLF